jgi:hypothetical protein
LLLNENRLRKSSFHPFSAQAVPRAGFEPEKTAVERDSEVRIPPWAQLAQRTGTRTELEDLVDGIVLVNLV